jgi:hypothetical protein
LTPHLDSIKTMADITVALPKLYPAQAVIFGKKKRNNLLVLSRRWGKTTYSTRVLLHGALVKEGFLGAWSAPTWKLMLSTFEEHRDILGPVISRVTREDRRIELINGSVLEYWSSDDPSAGRGRKYHTWVADETQRQRNINAFLRGSVRPCLADYRGDLHVLGTANGEGSDFHEFYLDCAADQENWFVAHGSLDQNIYIHPEEIAQMRRDLGPELAAQELDSLWVRVDGVAPMVRKTVWDGLYEERDDRTQSRVLALDGSVSGDTTALVSVWRDPFTEHYYTDHDDVTLITPDPMTGEVDWGRLEDLIWRKWQTGRYSLLAYDPYQAVSMVQRLRKRGVRVFEFTQNQMRLKADSHLRQVLNEGRYHHPDHEDLTEHMLAATIKYSQDQKQIRMVKAQKTSKIDLAVALSMGVWALHLNGARGNQTYAPLSGGTNRGALHPPISSAGLPLLSDHYNPWK